MLALPNAKQFVHEALTYFIHAFEVHDHVIETFESSGQPFSLRSGHERSTGLEEADDGSGRVELEGVITRKA